MKTTDPDSVPVVPAWAFDMWREHVNVTMARIELSYVEEARRRRWAEYRWAQSGPNKIERQIGRAFRIKTKLLGVVPPPLAIDGHAYHQRQKNRVKRKSR